MPTFAVTYSYTDGTTAGRDQHRPRHVEFLQSQFDGGRLVKSGPFGPDEAPGALLLINGESKADVEALMDQDPFFQNNLVEERSNRQWNIFFGANEK
ncbi:MAG: YciI family protein [Cellulosimicrobium cellulans]